MRNITRNNNYLPCLPKVKLESSKKSFSFIRAKMFNELPLGICRASSLKEFNINLFNKIFKFCFLMITECFMVGFNFIFGYSDSISDFIRDFFFDFLFHSHVNHLCTLCIVFTLSVCLQKCWETCSQISLQEVLHISSDNFFNSVRKSLNSCPSACLYVKNFYLRIV